MSTSCWLAFRSSIYCWHEPWPERIRFTGFVSSYSSKPSPKLLLQLRCRHSQIEFQISLNDMCFGTGKRCPPPSQLSHYYPSKTLLPKKWLCMSSKMWAAYCILERCGQIVYWPFMSLKASITLFQLRCHLIMIYKDVFV